MLLLIDDKNKLKRLDSGVTKERTWHQFRLVSSLFLGNALDWMNANRFFFSVSEVSESADFVICVISYFLAIFYTY